MILSSILAAAAIVSACEWGPVRGANAYKGDVVSAIDRYTELSPGVRAELKRKVAAREYDDVATIKANEIVGKHAYSDLRRMHFGLNKVCAGNVSRNTWKSTDSEDALMYCVDSICLAYPAVCRNVSLVTRETVVQRSSSGGGMSSPGGIGIVTLRLDFGDFQPPPWVPSVRIEQAMIKVERSEPPAGSWSHLREAGWPGLFDWQRPPLPAALGGGDSGVPSVGTDMDLVTPVPGPAAWVGLLIGLPLLAVARKWSQRKT